jgi:LacI family transcriptional regulator
MSRAFKVALLVETSRGYGRALLRGIVRYSRLHGPWGFYVTPGDFEQVLPRMRSWGGTGIIARIETPEVARAILDSGLPTIALDLSEIQLQPDHPLSLLSEVASDSRGAARLAAEHLLERGFGHYAFVGVADRVWSQRRERSFCARVRQAGFSAQVYYPPRLIRDRVWEREEPILARWLRGLPVPIGLMACNDDRGREVLEACRAAGLRVPEELAVVAVDNDELLCDLADPPLSSVALNAEAGGYRVAALLDRMMQAHRRGRVLKPRRLVVEPTCVVTRRSTDIVALDDPEVAAALHFLHDRAAEQIGVGDLVRHLLISRRSLEIRFRRVVGRTIHEELQRVRLERARRLLLETDLALPSVAEASGFASASYLAQVFRCAFQVTPARFRRQARTPST